MSLLRAEPPPRATRSPEAADARRSRRRSACRGQPPAAADAAPAAPAEPEMIEVWRPGRPPGEQRRPREGERRGRRRRHERPGAKPEGQTATGDAPAVAADGQPSPPMHAAAPTASARNATGVRATAAAIAANARTARASRPRPRLPSATAPTERCRPQAAADRPDRRPSAPRSSATRPDRAGRIAVRIAGRGVTAIAAATVGPRSHLGLEPGAAQRRRQGARSEFAVRQAAGLEGAASRATRNEP